ncbi:MAG: NOP5/NOP56 family protein [Candidatus Aenigmatarchaeota archaeon]
MSAKKTAYVAIAPFGAFAFSDNEEVLRFELFDKDPKKALEQYDAGSSSILAQLDGYDIQQGEVAHAILRKKLRELGISLQFHSDEAFNKFLSDFCFCYSKAKMRFVFSKDKFIIQANNALDDISKISNLMSERLKEWFGLHYPECRLSHKELVKHVATYGSKNNFPTFTESVGLDLSEEDILVIQSYAQVIEKINEERRQLEAYIKTSIRELMPNSSALIDEILLAKMVASAGSIERLARLSASSIQLIGAEKALFRHLKKQGKSPKFGMIFISSWIQASSDDQKGKVARILSAKLMQSIRIDFYSGRDESHRIRKELEDAIKKADR